MKRLRSRGPRGRGQTLVEVIIASGIIMTAVASALTLMTSSLRASKTAEAQITAGNLAREGIEVVRAMRDGNWLNGVDFDTGLYAAGNDYTAVAKFDPAANSWTLDFAPNATSHARAQMYRYSGTRLGLMTQGYDAAAAATLGLSSTLYKRIVTLDAICANGTIAVSGSSCAVGTKIGIRITSHVEWQLSGSPKTLSVEERMMDWR